MGTKADFFVGIGPSAEWIGSLTWDGYPSGTPRPVTTATTEQQYRDEVEAILADDDLVTTRPAEGWPWPWRDSRTTDYAYAWCADGIVRVSRYGRRWETLAERDARIAAPATVAYDDNCEPNLGPGLTDDEVVDMTARAADYGTMMAKSGISISIGEG